MAKNVLGLFENSSDAQAAVRDLERAGFSGNNVSVIQNASDRLSSSFEQLGVQQHDGTRYLEGLRDGGTLVILR